MGQVPLVLFVLQPSPNQQPFSPKVNISATEIKPAVAFLTRRVEEAQIVTTAKKSISLVLSERGYST